MKLERAIELTEALLDGEVLAGMDGNAYLDGAQMEALRKLVAAAKDERPVETLEKIAYPKNWPGEGLLQAHRPDDAFLRDWMQAVAASTLTEVLNDRIH